MNFLEKDLEDLIFDSLKTKESRNNIIDKGLNILRNYDLVFRQVDLCKYGRLDLLFIKYNHTGPSIGCFKYLNVMVMEIKKGEINIETYLQAVRYCKGIEVMFSGSNFKCEFHITLVGNSIPSSDFIYMPDIIENLSLYTLKLDLNHGITFKDEKDYHLSNEQVIRNPANVSVFSKYIKSKISTYVSEDGLPF